MEFFEFSPPKPLPKHSPVKVPVSSEQQNEEKPILELKPFSVIPHVSFSKVRLGTSKSCILYVHNPLDECQVVRVEKFPSDKGFSINIKEFSVQPGDLKSVIIAWTPEKSINCRETVVFKSTSGCKSHAYLLGTAYSPPRKVIQKKVISTKSRRHQKKISSPRIIRTANVGSKDAFCVENDEIPEETKENFDSLNSKSTPLGNFPEVSNFKFSIPEPRASFSLKLGNEFPDSPIRRQTYTINSMLSFGRESEVLPMKFKDCLDNTWNKNEVHFNTKDSTAQHFQNTFSVSKTSLAAPSVEVTKCEENLDDSLENRNENFQSMNKNLFFMEIPLSSSDVSSKISSVSESSAQCKKDSRMTYSKKHFEKKMQKSPFKAKIIKQKVVTSVDTVRKNSSAVLKSGTGVKNKEKPSKFMPKKLCLTKPRITESIVYHRNPFASMNVYYDEHWIEKQEAAFTSWLNFILTPNDDFNSKDVKVDSAKLWIESIKETSSTPAPTKEELSLKAYTALKNLNLLRSASFSLYQSEDVVQVIKKIEKEVDLKRISIRKDRAIYADLGIKKDILEMLLSYNTLWLRIGLETVYGEVITLLSNSDVIGLSRFIIHRFLQNPEIASKYSHPAVINYYKKGYDDEIHRFILKKFLLLVFFLDTAKNVHLIKHNPCLFNKNSKYKSSRDLLLAFSREYLGGEGDVTKHLRYLGYKVSYQQTALEEFDFSVRNIATDLRCGLRLGRVVELLLQDWTVSQMLRINTLNRLTKIHNNDVILKALKKADIEIENNIEAKHITEGYREKTLDLLWQIIFKTQISKLINKDLLKKENAFLYRSLKLREDFAAYNALRNCNTPADEPQMSFVESKLYKENEILQLLFQWCQNVCAHYNVKVHNFTSSFSDGRVLCLLLHHYHPNILSYESIKFETSNSYFEEQMKIMEENESCPFFMKNGQSDKLMDKLLKNEKDNLTLVFQKFQEIGHIPILSCPSDMSNTMPDEKVTITLVSYINIRLMELSIEIRAARKILHAWQRYKLRKQHEKLKIEISAAKIIQKAWRMYLRKKMSERENKSAIVIQSFWRMHCAKKTLANMKKKKELEWLTQKAIIIQANYRGFLTRKHLLKCHQAAIVIQTYFRRWIAKVSYIKLRNVVLQIQHNYRAKVKGRTQRLQYLKMRETIIMLQSYIRGKLVRKCVKKQLSSAVKIQAYVKMWLMRKKYIKIRNACIVIQQWFKGYMLTEFYSQEYQNYRTAAIAIQRWYRNAKIQQHRVKCVVKLQSLVRRYIARKRYLNLKNNVIKIQNWWRAVLVGKKTRLLYLQYYRSIVCIQSFIRKCIASKRYSKLKKSAITIQKYIRTFIAKREFVRLKKNVIYIQTLWRSKIIARKTHLDYLLFRKNVIKIQAFVRSFLARNQFQRMQRAAVIIQKTFRMYIAHKNFCSLKSSTVCIQRKWKAIIYARKIRSSYLLYRNCVIFVQSLVRRQIAYHNFRIKRASAIVIQKNVRMFIARKQFLEKKKSAELIQKWWKNHLFGCQVRKEFVIQRCAAIKIQSVYRMFNCRKNLRLLKKSVATVEKYVLGKKERQKFMHTKKNIIKLQSLFKAYVCRKKYLNIINSVILIQAFTRKCIAQKLYLKTKESVIKIQRYYRAYKLMGLEKNRYLKIKFGFIQLQALFRGRCVRKNMKLLNEKAVIIQKTYRRWKAESDYKEFKKACLIVQQRYRAKQQMEKQRKEYIKIRNATIKIQAFIRGYLAHKKYKTVKKSAIKIQAYIRMIRCYKAYLKQQKAAVVIQRWYRSFKYMKKIQSSYLQTRASVIFLQSRVRSVIMRKRYLEYRSSVIKIQNYYRSYKIMCSERQNYLRVRQGFIRLQALYKGKLARKQIQLLNEKATIIQTVYRKWRAESQFKNLKEACLAIQHRYRAKLLMKKQYQEYEIMKKSTVKIQAHIRSYIMCKKYKKLKSSAIKIQSYFRMWRCRKMYCSMQKAAIIIQQYYCSFKLMKMIQNDYLHTKSSVIFLQSKVRTMIIRRKYLEYKASAIKIQRYYRSYKTMCAENQNYLKVRYGFIQLQALYRGWCVRKNLKLLHQKSVIIQTSYRKWRAETRYKKLKEACLNIQQKYRAKLQMKKEIDNYIKTRNSIIKIQASVRGYIAYKKYKSLKSSVIKIQSYIRMFSCYKKYQNMKKSIITIQRYYRSFKQMKCVQRDYFHTRLSVIFLQSKVRSMIAQKKFIKIKSSVIKIQRYYRSYKLTCNKRYEYLAVRNGIIQLQALYRGRCIRKNLELLHIKAIIIQKAYRRWKAESKFKLLKLSVIKIQSFVRMIKCYKTYHNNRRAAVIIQRHYRSFKQMKKIQADYQQVKSSVIIMQSKIRSKIAHTKFLKFRLSVIKIQQYYRSYKLMCKERENFLKIRRGVIHLQALYRGRCVRKNMEMLNMKAVIIQKTYRKWKCESQYKQIQFAATKIQSYIRMIRCYKIYHKMITATILIQQHYRSFRQMKETQMKYLQMRSSVIFLQSKVRSIRARNEFLKIRTSVIKIQRLYRSYKLMCTEKQNYITTKNGFIKLQALYRGRLVRKNVELLHRKAVIIQSAYRRWHVESRYKLLKLSVIKIQSYIRMIRCYKAYCNMKKAAIVIQRWYRLFKLMKTVKKNYLQTRSSVISLQARVRMIITRKAYLKQKNACIMIQAYIRMHLLQKKYNKIRSAAIIIQRYYRSYRLMKVERNYFIRQKTAIVFLQSKFRSIIARRKFLKIKYACIVIQAFVRMAIFRTRYKRKCNAALTIQRYYRRYRITAQHYETTRKQHQWYLSLKRSLIQFQRAARGYLLRRHNAAVCIQSYFRMWCILKEYKKTRAAIKIQACWRAYIVRRSITDKKIFEVRKKIEAADATESQKLKNRTTRSLELLFKEASLEKILTALEHLDVCTQLSPNCCERLVQSGGLTILIHLVQACNRSIPHMEVIKYVTNILLNLAKYEKTVNFVWEEEYSLETILHLMKIFREKGTDIFTKCCSLLWIFCQDPTKAEYMKEKTVLTEQIRSFHYLLTRKQSIEAKRLVLKAISSSTFNTSSLSTTLNASVSQRSNNRNASHIHPDWMLGKHRRREFKDSIVAISCIMKSLDLKGKKTANTT